MKVERYLEGTDGSSFYFSEDQMSTESFENGNIILTRKETTTASAGINVYETYKIKL